MDNAGSRRAALIAVTLMSFASPFMLSGVNIGLPAIGDEFHTSAIMLTWMSTAYSLATAVFLVPFGKLADIYGRKRLFIIGVALYALSSLLCTFAPSAGVLIGVRAFQGLSASMTLATSTAILTSAYPASERGRVLGINTAAVYLGLSAGPFLGGLIVQDLGWRAVFALNIPLAALTLGFTLARVRGEWADSPDDRLDWISAVIYGVAVVSLVVGFGAITKAYGLWVVLLGVAAGGAFIVRQSRLATPLLDLDIFRGNRVFTFSSLAALVNYAATASISYLMPLYLQYIKAMTASEAGLVLAAQPIVQTIFSPLAGHISDRIEARYVASLGMGFVAAGIVMLTALNAETSLAYIILCLLMLGFGFALFSSPNTSAIMGAVGRRHYGVASGLLATMRTFGQVMSMSMVMVLLSIYMGQAQITAEYYPQFMTSTHTAFAISAVLCSLGVLASLARGKNVLAARAEAGGADSPQS